MIGEIAARLSGGYMSGWTFPYSSGFELTKEAMKIALGIPSDFSNITEIPSTKFSHERAFISIPGKIKKIYGEEKAWASPFVKNIFFRVKEGSEVDFPRNNVEKCGNVISSSKERELSKKGAESAVAQIVLRLEPKNPQTENFLSGVELPQEKGFLLPYRVGENQEGVRWDACSGLDYLGVKIDKKRNWNLPRGEASEISAKSSKVKVFVIPTDEEMVIAKETQKLLKNQK